MTEPTLVLSCLAQDYNASTYTCAAPFYSLPEGSLPTMSIDDAQAIGMECALLLAVAWGIRVCKRAVERIG